MDTPVVPGLTISLFVSPKPEAPEGQEPTRAASAGTPLSGLGTGNPLWLLALLILHHPGPQDQKIYAEELWPEYFKSPQNPFAALENLRQTLKRLRRALGEHGHRVVTTRREHVTTLHIDLDGAEVDLIRFDRAVACGDMAALAEASELYRGPLLPDCQVPAIVEARHKRAMQCLAAREQLAALALDNRDYPLAIRHAGLMVAGDPRHEGAVRLLMRALAASGEYSAAIDAYRRLRHALQQELQWQPGRQYAEPAAETVDLYETIRAEQQRIKTANPPPVIGSLPTPAVEIPVYYLTELIGRDDLIRDLKMLLRSQRLVTLVGAGGVGKTRLAAHVAAESADHFPDGVWFVELAALTQPELLAETVGRELRVPQAEEPSALAGLVNHLRSRCLLLVLDNCEHLIVACLHLIEPLLRECPALRILATSRQLLGLVGEQVRRVPSLSLPPDLPEVTVDQVLASAAGRLFVTLAMAANDEFALTNQNAATVGHICRQLDGIPLAIELAAARVAVLSVQQIAVRLHNRFALLTNGSPSLSRHQTLQATIDWSYDLLTARQKTLLGCLSVFKGGWTLEAAEAVCCAEGVQAFRYSGVQEQVQRHQWASLNTQTPEYLNTDEVLDLLTSLVNQSLVIAEEQHGAMRYRLLETVREYALERLVESREVPWVRERHRDYYLALAEELAPRLNGPQQRASLERLEAEHANLLAALEVCSTAVGDVRWRMGVALCRFWELRGYYSEGLRYFEALLAQRDAPTPLPAKALYAAARMMRCHGDFNAAFELMEESLELFRREGDPLETARALLDSGIIQRYRNNDADGLRRYQESEALFRQSNDLPGLARVADLMGYVKLHAKDIPGAMRHFEESIAICRELNDQDGVAKTLVGLASAVRLTGDVQSARTLLEEARDIQAEVGSRMGVAGAMIEIAHCTHGRDELRDRYHLYEQSLKIYREVEDNFHIVRLLDGLALLDCVKGDINCAESRIHEIARRSRDGQGRPGYALLFLHAELALHRNDLPLARTLTEDSQRDVSVSRDEAFMILALNQRGVILAHSGDAAQAEHCFSAVLQRCHPVADVAEIIDGRNGLGLTACLLADFGQACAHLTISLGCLSKLDDWARTAVCLEVLATATHGRRHPEYAATLLGAACALRAAVGAPLPLYARTRYDDFLGVVRASLSTERFTAAWHEGAGLSREQAIHCALDFAGTE